ncbi:MAG: gliding motility-associated C-terminal domain-containing protein [Bacteroidetes bacterium]|nr:gliding motility-associated C-terminal domain-containing protein [Bacteroidota bacterium]
MSRRVFIALIFIFPTLDLFAQPLPVPDLRCVSVNGDSVTLSWITADTTSFNLYHIYYSYDKYARYNKLSLVVHNYETTSFYQENNVQINPVYYYMVTADSIEYGTESLHSDTVSTIFMTVTPLAGNSIANLTWNHISANLAGQYDIYRRLELSDWKYLTSTTNLFYNDTVRYPFCIDTLIQYRVEIQDDVLECSSFSTIGSGYFSDGIDPVMVEMDTVSVNLQGDVIITWFAVTGDTIKEYVIYRQDYAGGTFDIKGTVSGNETSFIDYELEATIHSVAYRVAAVDGCNNIGLGGFLNPYSTIFIDQIDFNYCDTQIQLNWTPNENLSPPVQGYRLYKVDPSSSSSEYIGETSDTSYTYFYPFDSDSTYCFYVRAYNNSGKSSSSAVRCFIANRPPQPDTLNFKIASVDTVGNNFIELSFFADTATIGTSAVIYRKTSLTDTYISIDTIPNLAMLSDPLVTYRDNNVNVNDQSYYYKITVIDSCNNEAWLPFNEIRTILLRGMLKDNNVNWLFWNAFETLTGQVTAYELYRKIDGIVDTVIILPPTSLDYEDDISSFAQSAGRFSYMVRADIFFYAPDLYREIVYSYSNETLLTQRASLFLPNAFTPNNDGINDDFKPVNFFTDQTGDYQMVIYNRWGQKIFETNDIQEPWKGNYKGDPAPSGVYVYYITYKSLEGLDIQKHGTVTLLR